MLGKDLSFGSDAVITLNLPNKSSPKKNYLYKDWHQEIWSGANHTSVQIWTPIFQNNTKYGQMELMLDSHKWGMIPNKNRAPIELPKQFKTKKINLQYGDVLIFSSLLLHRSLPTQFPRLALPLLIKNFKYKDID